jgi:hypothetical protein
MVFNEHGRAGSGPNYDAPRELQDLPAGQAVRFFLSSSSCTEIPSLANTSTLSSTTSANLMMQTPQRALP